MCLFLITDITAIDLTGWMSITTRYAYYPYYSEVCIEQQDVDWYNNMKTFMCRDLWSRERAGVRVEIKFNAPVTLCEVEVYANNG